MQKYAFTARIVPGMGGGAGVLFPFDVREEFGTEGKVPVKATFDGVPYSGSLMRCGPPEHMLGLLKSIRDQIGKGPGDTVSVEVWKDDAERTVAVPPEMAKLLKKERLTQTFENLSYTHRRGYVRWITEAKKEETRARRLAQSVVMLRAGVKSPG